MGSEVNRTEQWRNIQSQKKGTYIMYIPFNIFRFPKNYGAIAF